MTPPIDSGSPAPTWSGCRSTATSSRPPMGTSTTAGRFTGPFSRFDDADGAPTRRRRGAAARRAARRRGRHLVRRRGWRGVAAAGRMDDRHRRAADEQWQTATSGASVDSIRSCTAAAPRPTSSSPSAGWGAVADAVAVGARLVVVAEDRPFHEQAVRAAALAARRPRHRPDRWPAPVGAAGRCSSAPLASIPATGPRTTTAAARPSAPPR